MALHSRTNLRSALGVAALAAAAFTATPALAQADWCKSKWGPNDQIGALNLLTPAITQAAAKLIKTGKTYRLLASATLDGPFEFVQFVEPSDSPEGALEVETTSARQFYIIEVE